MVYLGSGGEEDYAGKDVAGKAVLVEVSYAPATPEKAMLASEHHAAAMICMNWGTTEHELICNRGLKAVWGKPYTGELSHNSAARGGKCYPEGRRVFKRTVPEK